MNYESRAEGASAPSRTYGATVRRERDSSGTTEAHEMREGDGADSPTQANIAPSRTMVRQCE
jgi:hypothetical protein